MLSCNQPFRRFQGPVQRYGEKGFIEEFDGLAGIKRASCRIIEVATQKDAAQPVAQIDFARGINSVRPISQSDYP